MLLSQSLKAGHCRVFNYTPKSERIKTASKVDLHILAGDTCAKPTCLGSCLHIPQCSLQLAKLPPGGWQAQSTHQLTARGNNLPHRTLYLESSLGNANMFWA